MSTLQWIQHSAPHSSFFGAQHSKLYRTRSCDLLTKTRTPSIRRAISASFDSFSEEEYFKKFQVSDDEDGDSSSSSSGSFIDSHNVDMKMLEHGMPFDPLEPPHWHEKVEIKSVEIPVSLRMIKIKKECSGGLMVAEESGYCCVKKAFSSMVFIIRELQSFSLQNREVLYYQDLQGIVSRVQEEMQGSFVWLFQQVFSNTPSLMVYVMILLANYSVHSMANSTAIAATAAADPPQAYVATTDSTSMVKDHSYRFDSSAIKSFSVSSFTGKTTSIGGGSGDGVNYKSMAGGIDDDMSNSFDLNQIIFPDEVSSVSNQLELELWNKVVDEASEMQAAMTSEALDHETLQGFVSPVNVKIGEDDYADYFRTELLYQTGLAQEPDNPLLLANYAQFLFLVAQDYDRAEEYFKKAVVVEPKDAEALNKYANFLWKARDDLWAAEETYQEAIDAEPSNSFYAANYAHFLWNTGGEDTCFPLTSTEDDIDI